MTIINLCPHARALAALIPIAAGSPEWIAGGMFPKAYQGGAHPAYGWRHIISSEQQILAILSNALWRNIYFLNAPKRMSDYGWAGQPVGSKSGPIGDGVWIDEYGHLCMSSEYGEQASPDSPKILRISGYDLQHLYINHLIAAYDSPLSANMTLGGFKVRTLIEWIVRGIMASAAGQVRNLSWAEKDYPNHRAAYCVLRATYLAKTHKDAEGKALIDDADFALIAAWFNKVVLPICEGPTRTWNDYDFKKSGLEPSITQNPLNAEQVYNMRNWLFCNLYDWSKLDLAAHFKERLDLVLMRWARYMRTLTPSAWGVSFPDSMLGIVPETWEGATVHYQPGNIAPYWSVRSFDVAGTLLGDSSLKAMALNTAKAHSSELAWCVGADMKPLGVAVGPKP